MNYDLQVINKGKAVRMLDHEVAWCKRHMDPKDTSAREYQQGFAAGLEQAIHIIKQVVPSKSGKV